MAPWPIVTASRGLHSTRVAYADDMSSVLFSAVWHRIHGLPFDVEARANCVRAWNAESVRLGNSVPAGTQIPATGFMCTDDQSVEASRERWRPARCPYALPSGS